MLNCKIIQLCIYYGNRGRVKIVISGETRVISKMRKSQYYFTPLFRFARKRDPAAVSVNVILRETKLYSVLLRVCETRVKSSERVIGIFDEYYIGSRYERGVSGRGLQSRSALRKTNKFQIIPSCRTWCTTSAFLNASQTSRRRRGDVFGETLTPRLSIPLHYWISGVK